jgi:arsenate reductase (thioredoxin)
VGARVSEDHLAPAERAAAGSYVGCIAGALSRAEYLDGLAAAGFTDAQITGAAIGTSGRSHPPCTRPSHRPRNGPSGPAHRLTGDTAMTSIPEVPFICIHNAGRSQMAATLLDHEAAGRVRVTSAGSQPASQLNPAVVAAMAEIGLDISRQHPKPLTTGNVHAADVVITMGCGDACPVCPGKRYLDWDQPAR